MGEYTGYIYSITNEINGKSYIGKTNDLVRRWKEHCYSHGGTAILDKAFKKYGLEHFVFDIVAQIPFDNIEELNDVLAQLEMYYIELYDTYRNGYNATVGGDGTSGYKQSPETTEKIRQANIGRTVSDETRERISISRTGIHHTEEAKEAIRQALLYRDHSIYDRIAEKRRGVKRDPNVIMKGAVKRRKPILQYDLQGNFINEYPGIKFIEGFEGKNISACCRGRLRSTQGYIWRFKESEDFLKKIEIPSKWHTFKKAVVQYDLNGNLVAEYESIAFASKVTGIETSDICSCLKGRNATSGRYIWRYKEKEIPLHIEVLLPRKIYNGKGVLFKGKRIVQCTKSGEIIQEFATITIASLETQIGRTSINNCLHGRSKTAGGYVWKFKEEREVEDEAW